MKETIPVAGYRLETGVIRMPEYPLNGD